MLNLNLIVRLFSFIMSTNLLFYFFGILYIMYYIDIDIEILTIVAMLYFNRYKYYN